MSKLFEFGKTGRNKLLLGIKTLYDAVKITLGPQGHAVLIDKNFGSPIISKDGVTVAKEIFVKDSFENMGVQAVKEVAAKTGQDAGDGTTTATILAYWIFKKSLEALEKGINHVQFRKELMSAKDKLILFLKDHSIPVDSADMVRRVAYISSNMDDELADLVKEAYEEVGRHGLISFDESRTGKTCMEAVKGYEINKGWISPYFVTDQKRMKCELKDPLILVTDEKIAAVEDILGLLEGCAKQSKPLLLIAVDIAGEALNTLIINKMRNVLQCCAVKLPSTGYHSGQIAEDLAIITGAGVITKALNRSLQTLNMDDLGTCSKVIIDKYSCRFIDGKGDLEKIEGRIKQLEKEIETAVEPDFAKVRLGKIRGGIAVVYAGGATEMEQKERLLRLEDAVMATKAALDEGIIAGGGSAFLKYYFSCCKSFVTMGEQVLLDSILQPIKQIIVNSGKSPDKIIKQITKLDEKCGCSLSTTAGFDAVSLDIEDDVVLAGIIDPTKVLIKAVENAVSIAELLLSADCLIIDDPTIPKMPPPMM